MNMHSVLLYGCAVAVIVSGIQLLARLATKDCEEMSPPLALLRAWRQPLPRAATGLVATMVVLGVAQTAAPAMIDALERHPHGAWWRAVTALMVQSSGWFQLLFNLAALAVVAPLAERQFGSWRTLLVFTASGVTAQAVSMAGWSLQGGGDSVAICGLVGALSTWYAARGSVVALRRVALVIPAAGLVLCLLTNNHGLGLLVGSALGVGLATPARPPLAV
ncbi:rhomboid family intramembrane serine protease [Streptomyces hesseae]|uniref:Rhomboid family intramembrane serine protease n=1 Tax=Streptomyces hesseae TaxID=3075519 RepID=A0ABU2SVZ3_9ACTN|nr:rhomboid family intramembrane serine protease [Streptomyces sp. DSM 40473]MDT0453022.1 rhomboid family intramembrane serine protease [Streptomyces sp. DSM 40473]